MAADSTLRGKGYTLVNGDTVFIEHLALIHRDQDWYYSAEVSHNQSAVLFKLTSTDDDILKFENPQHDFPKQIVYKCTGPETMRATISGDGRSVDFDFRRIE